MGAFPVSHIGVHVPICSTLCVPTTDLFAWLFVFIAKFGGLNVIQGTFGSKIGSLDLRETV